MNSKLIGEFNNKYHRTELQCKNIQSQNTMYQDRIEQQKKKLDINKNDQEMHQNFNNEHKLILQQISKDRNQQQSILRDEARLLKELNEQKNLLQKEKEQIDFEYNAILIAFNEQTRKKEQSENKYNQLKEQNRELVVDNQALQSEIDFKQQKIEMIQAQIAKYKQEIQDMRETLAVENRDIIKPQSIAGSQYIQ